MLKLLENANHFSMSLGFFHRGNFQNELSTCPGWKNLGMHSSSMGIPQDLNDRCKRGKKLEW